MFFFTYLPQAAILALTSGPAAALSAALLVLSESSTIFMVLAKSLLVEDGLIDTFDGVRGPFCSAIISATCDLSIEPSTDKLPQTLVSKGQTALVSGSRQVKSGSDPMARLGKLVTAPFAKFAPAAIIRYLMYLPLNFIPVVGTIIFILLQGKNYGPRVHSRYFTLKGMSKQRREEVVEERRAAYTSFGTIAVLLEMVPIAGILFAFTNVTGAALWAADLEKGQEGTSPELREQAKKAA